MSDFKKGIRVLKTFHGIGGYIETGVQTVGKVSKGVVYLEDNEGRLETGVTYDLHGREIERFFLPIITDIRLATKDDIATAQEQEE